MTDALYDRFDGMRDADQLREQAIQVVAKLMYEIRLRKCERRGCGIGRYYKFHRWLDRYSAVMIREDLWLLHNLGQIG